MTSVRDTVHAAHCCLKHGCKYADEDCPVYSGKIEQKYPCEYCREDEIDYGVKPPDIEWDRPNFGTRPPDIDWTLPKLSEPPEPPEPPSKRIIREDISKDFFKGFLSALLVIILLHIGLCYILLY